MARRALPCWLMLPLSLVGGVDDPITIIEQSDVFVSGADGYHTYRIPSVVQAPDGDLLAFCEGRRSGRGDSGDIDLLMKRSSDGGRTWSDTVVIWDDDENTCGNPCPVVDRETGEVLLLATHNLGTDHERQIIDGQSQGTRTVWILRSDDGGYSWSAPQNITSTVKLVDWTWYATGPGAGIQVERGEHAGRLIIPCDHIEAQTKHYYSHVIYSDDHGATWRLGGSSPEHQVNECEVVELTDGRLMLNMRNYDRSQSARQVCFSADGGVTWAEQHHDAFLIEPICQASIRRIAWPRDDGRPGLIAFSNPARTDRRTNMMLRLSADDGRTWCASAPLHTGSSAYSCLVALSASTIGCLFEADDYGRITFIRSSIAPLEDAQYTLNRIPPSNGVRNLIVDDSLHGWHTVGGGEWTCAGGVITGRLAADEPRHGLLVSDAEFDDFIVEFDYRVIAGDSGFYFRAEESDDSVGVHGFQVEVDLVEPGGLYETGGRAWVIKPDRDEARRWHTPGAWNHVRLSAIGQRTVVHVNGHMTADLHDPAGRRRGHFALQLHGSQEMDVHYRNIHLVEK